MDEQLTSSVLPPGCVRGPGPCIVIRYLRPKRILGTIEPEVRADLLDVRSRMQLSTSWDSGRIKEDGSRETCGNKVLHLGATLRLLTT